MSFSKNLLLALAVGLFLSTHALTIDRRDSKPNLPYDDNTTKDCTWWLDYDKSQDCAQMLAENWIDLDVFRRWNPAIGPDCSGLTVGKSYCIEAPDNPVTTAPSSTPTPTLSPSSSSAKPAVSSPAISTRSSVVSSSPTTTTSAGNGVETPQPTQPGMVTNCAKFHWIAKGVVCSQVISFQKITREDFVRWNPTVLSDCSGMLSEVNVCVGVLSSATTTIPVTTTQPSTTTTAGNGVETPLPTQPGMVSNCAKFHWIAPGVSCSQVTSFHKISLADFVKWNPTVRDDCTGMQASVNVCVGIIGGSTPTPTTSAGNGVQTPQPTQPGMVTNCARFHFIAPGVVCSQVTSFQKISLADFVKWNPTVRDDCTGMQANVNVCVGIIGGSTTPTTPTTTTTAGNGVQTPQPTQPGMVTNCKKFHYAEAGVVCSQITSYNHISLEDFVKWNSGVGSDCRSMWAKTYTCVGV